MLGETSLVLFSARIAYSVLVDPEIPLISCSRLDVVHLFADVSYTQFFSRASSHSRD